MASACSAGLSTDSGQKSTNTSGFGDCLERPSKYSQPKADIPEIGERPETGKGKVSARTPPSCSAFAAQNAQDHSEIFTWMFDRKVLPRSLASDQDLFEEYNRMTGLIWPAEWMECENCPTVDNGIAPLLDKLHSTILHMSSGNRHQHLLKICPRGKFPVDLRILADQPSTILQASLRSTGKMVESQQQEKVAGISWRHDHDRLVFDFFMRPLHWHGHSKSANWPILSSRNQSARLVLEKTLRFPKSDMPDRYALASSMAALPALYDTQVEKWVQERSISADISAVGQREADSNYRINTRMRSWRLSPPNTAELIASVSPAKGRCDALGCLTVALQGVKAKTTEGFPLVIHASHQQRGQTKSDHKKTVSVPGLLSVLYGPFSSRRRDHVSEDSELKPVDVLAAGTQALIVDDIDDNGMTENDVEDAKEVEGPPEDNSDSVLLDLPILVVKHRKNSEKLEKVVNQLRMHLTASVKFLETIGINEFTVYCMQTDGPIAAFSAAVLKKENGTTHLFERHMQEIDISTPLGAWHLATVLSRLGPLSNRRFWKKSSVLCSRN